VPASINEETSYDSILLQRAASLVVASGYIWCGLMLQTIRVGFHAWGRRWRLKVDIGFGFPSVAETVYHFAFDNQARSLTVSVDGADGELRLRSRPFQRRFDRPRKQIWRVSARFESATTSDRLSIADPRILNRPEPTRAGITKDWRSGEFGCESLPYPILWNGNHQIARLFTLGYLGTTYVAS